MMLKFLRYFLLAAALLAPFAKAGPAMAAILWAGGEDLDFTTPPPGTIAAGNNYDSVYARESVYTTDTNSPLRTGMFANSSTLWLHFEHDPYYSYSANKDWISLVDSTGVSRIVIRPTSTSFSPTISINKRNAAGTYTVLATSTYTITDARRTYDIFVNYAVSGQVTVYMNGQEIVTYSGDVTTDGQTTLAQAWLGFANSSSSYESHYSQVIVSTTDTRNMHLATIKPNANGNTMTWSGAVSDINEATTSDATVISSGTAGQTAQFTIPALPAGSYSVVAVIQSARALASPTGPQNFQFVARTGGTDYTSPSQALGAVFGPYSYIWSTNPNTGTAWTTGELGAAGFNLGIKSQN